MKKTLLLAPFTALLLFACEKDSTDDVEIKDVVIPTQVTYNASIAPLMLQSCATTNCHKAPTNIAGLNLETYDDVKKYVADGRILNRINKNPGESGFMPSGGAKLSSSKIELITKWQTDGFLKSATDTANTDTGNTDTGNTDTGNTDTGNTDTAPKSTYTNDVKPLLTKCTGCHSGSSARAGLSLDNFNDVKNAITKITDRINREEGSGGFMPQFGQKYSQTELDAIAKWNTDGLLE